MYKEVKEFIEHNPVLMLANIGMDGLPKNRAMITLGIHSDTLWFAVTKDKNIYKELLADNNVELCGVALSRWVRISGKAVFEKDEKVKRDILQKSDIMEKFYKHKEQPLDEVEVFYIKISNGMLGDYNTSLKIEF